MSSEDYASWEAPLSVLELPDIKDGSRSFPLDDDLSDNNPPTSPDGTYPASPTPTSYSFEDPIKEVDRSRSVPTLRSPEASRPLQRAQTASAHVRSTSRLQVLEEALRAVQEEGSQMNPDDVVDAAHLVHQIGGVLNRQLKKRLGSEGQ